MSKKSGFSFGAGGELGGRRGSQLAVVEEAPQLFARRQSNARPFIISESDNPYDKHDYISTARHHGLGHARTQSRQRNNGRPKTLDRLLSAAGVTKVQRHTTKRSRRIAAFALLATVVFLLNHYSRSGSRSFGSDISRPFATARRYLTPAGFAAGGLSARSEQETTAAGAKAGSSSSHTFHPNGLMLVNPNGPHPIHALIDNADRKWKNLLNKQSQSLEEASREYKRRYKRNPPAGFDAWCVSATKCLSLNLSADSRETRWKFAKANNVQIVDEYDQISRDFDPYWAMEPIDLRHRNKVMQDREHTFTLSIKNGRVSRHGEHADLDRARDMASLVSKFSRHVPGEVNMTFIIDDQPAVLMGWNQKDRMIELAQQGECESDRCRISTRTQAD